MRAIVYTAYGPPDVLQLQEVEKPAPKEGEVLVQVHASSANAFDWHYMRAAPFVTRLDSGLLGPKYRILGVDIAGRVEAVGRDVKQFQPGDEVYGDISACGLGGFAEYVSVPGRELAPKPANMTFEEAATVPMAGVTALQGLRDYGHAQRQPGQEVLINGASGGVGTFAVQIAKAFGATVTGVCSTRNLDMVRSLGADQVIDYTQEDFTTSGQHYDLIHDLVANRPLSDYKRALRPQGRYVACAFSPVAMLLGPLISMFGRKKVGAYVAKPSAEDLLFIKELRIEDGPRMKRLWPRARGRADRLLKRMSHIHVVLDEIGNTGEDGGTES